MLTGRQLYNFQNKLMEEHFLRVMGSTQEERNKALKPVKAKIDAAIEEFRQHLENAYLPDATQEAKEELWTYIWEKRNEKTKTRALRYYEMETLYARIAKIVSLA